MDNEKLSQEEINALLEAANTANSKKNSKNSSNALLLSEMEKDAIGELGNISMGSAATVISTLLGKKVDITTPSVKETTVSEVRKSFSNEKVVVRVDYSKGLSGSNAFLLEPRMVAIIADIMMGGSGESVSDGLDEIKLSAVGEAMNQMMGSASTALSEVIKNPVDITPPEVEIMNFKNEDVKFPPVYEGEEVVEVRFKVKVEDLVKGDMMQLMSPSFAKRFAKFLTGTLPSEIEGKKPAHPATKEETAIREKKPKERTSSQSVKKAEFQELKEESTTPISSNKLEVLFDIPLDLSVELGKTSMTLKQVLDLGSGSLVELDKLTGEPVDILVNGETIAEGEVVVIGENFGIRITKILSKKERLYSLK